MPIFEIYDDQTSRCVKVDVKRITLGRTADNAVVIYDKIASRKHCEVRLTEIGYVLRDLKSRNGTLLNESPVDRPIPLRDGDEIAIGKASIRFWTSQAKMGKNTANMPFIERTAKKVSEPEAAKTAMKMPAHKQKPNLNNQPADNIKAKPDIQDDSDNEQWDLIIDSDIPVSADTEILTPKDLGDLTLNNIIPLNHEGKPAHPVGKGAEKVSQAMLRLKQLLLKSFQFQATDIHIEPKEEQLFLRYRIDGYLHRIGALDIKIAKSVYSIVKLLCNLDINKKNIMQDGSFAIQLPDRRVDMRVSIAPTTLGDKMVIRILDKNLAPTGLDSLGMEPYILQQVRDIAFRESSMIVVCGPTGSGKTTTVYAVLQEMNSSEKNIVTVEDPVEYKLENITQIQVNPKFNITFASALTSLLRQDPDVILVGEIRDSQTAQMALQSAMTGHLVLSTIHARDSIGSIFRLLDLGVEPFLLGSALSAVLSQRLMRQLCPQCKMKFMPAMKELTRIGLESLSGAELYAPVGCEKCLNIGYKGRFAIFEMLSVNNQVRDAIAHRPTIQELRIAAGDWIFQTLREDAVKKLKRGETSFEEYKAIASVER